MEDANKVVEDIDVNHDGELRCYIDIIDILLILLNICSSVVEFVKRAPKAVRFLRGKGKHKRCKSFVLRV